MSFRNKIKILCPSPSSFSKDGLSFVNKNFKADIKNLNQSQFDKIAHNYDAVLIRFNIVISEKIFSEKSRLKYIICPTTGLDHIDLTACRLNKVKVISLKNQKKFLKTITSTSELTIGLIISLMRNTNSAISSVKNFNWNFEFFRGFELKEKTIGIIGMGRLGKHVADIARALKLNIIYYDVIDKKIKNYKKVNLKILLQLSDIISLHLPLNEDTKHFLSYKEFNLMKKKPFVINTSRGSIINSRALINSLNTNKIKGAALDVVENEHKNIKGNNLVKFAKNNSNLIITPHIGGCTFEANSKTDLFILKKFIETIKQKRGKI